MGAADFYTNRLDLANLLDVYAKKGIAESGFVEAVQQMDDAFCGNHINVTGIARRLRVSNTTARMMIESFFEFAREFFH